MLLPYEMTTRAGEGLWCLLDRVPCDFVGPDAGSVCLVYTESAHAGTCFLRVVCSVLTHRVSRGCFLLTFP